MDYTTNSATGMPNLCREGHMFIWSGKGTHTADIDAVIPPDGWPCVCGQAVYKRGAGLVGAGPKRENEDMGKQFIDLTGMQYGDYTVLKYAPRSRRDLGRSPRTYWLVRCVCGVRNIVIGHHISAGTARKTCDHDPARLTNREKEVALLVAQKLQNKEIARRLVVTTRTVKTHLEHIYDKCDLHSRKELAVMIVKMEKTT